MVLQEVFQDTCHLLFWEVSLEVWGSQGYCLAVLRKPHSLRRSLESMQVNHGLLPTLGHFPDTKRISERSRVSAETLLWGQAASMCSVPWPWEDHERHP